MKSYDTEPPKWYNCHQISSTKNKLISQHYNYTEDNTTYKNNNNNEKKRKSSNHKCNNKSNKKINNNNNERIITTKNKIKQNPNNQKSYSKLNMFLTILLYFLLTNCISLCYTKEASYYHNHNDGDGIFFIYYIYIFLVVILFIFI